MYGISTSDVLYYRRSWKAPITGLFLMGVAGLVGIPILAGIYAFLMNFVPFLIVRVILMLGYPLICGAVIAQAAKTGKVRNKGLILCAGILFGLFAEYTGWIFWIAILSKEISLLWSFFFPMNVAYFISAIAEIGVWSFRNVQPTGWFLYFFWFVEAVIVVGLTAYMTHKGNEDTPFCEESNEWAEKKSDIGLFAPIENPAEFKKEFEQAGYSIFNQFAPAQSGNRSTVVQLYECEECKNFFVLNIKDRTISFDSKGRKQEKLTPILSNLQVTPSIVAMIRSLMAKYTA
jgi:hypothetical protein